MARVLRLLRALPELLILVKGMASATLSVIYALCLLMMLLYVFAIIFVQLSAGSDLEGTHFGSVPHAMYVLLIHGAFLDNIGFFMDALGDEHIIYQAIFMVFVLFAALMVMNLMIGVLCEVVSAVSDYEKERYKIDVAKSVLRSHATESDKNGDSMITHDEFLHLLDSRDTVNALQDIGLCAVTLLEVADDIFADGPHSIDSFIEYVLKFRCSQPATLKDVVDLRNHITSTWQDVSSVKALRRSESREDLSRQQTHSPGARCMERYCNGTTEQQYQPWDLPGAPIIETYASHPMPAQCPDDRGAEIAAANGFCLPKGVQPLQNGDISARLDMLTSAVIGMRSEVLKEIGDLKERTSRIESKLGVFEHRGNL